MWAELDAGFVWLALFVELGELPDCYPPQDPRRVVK